MAPDEAYYWVWSKALAPGYLDHPPMVALWIRAGTWLAGDGNLGVRLLAPLAAALGSILLVQAGKDLLGSRRQGLWAAGLLNATVLFAVGATTMTPDTPLLLFWTASIWALARLHATGRGTWWLAVGAAAGGALLSKYTAVLLGPVILLWLLASPKLRPWLRCWQPWAAAAIAAVIFSPVLAWNAEHDWASFAKQGARAADWDPARAVQFVTELLGGQIGLGTPLVALLCAAGMGLAWRRAWSQNPEWLLIALSAWIPAVVFLQHALGDRVQANWPAIIFPTAALAATSLGTAWRRLVPAAIATGFAITATVWIQAAAAPLRLPMRLDPTLLRVGGWADLARDIEATARTEGASFVAVDNYGQAALLARLLPPNEAVLGAEGRWSLFNLPDAAPIILGRTGILVRSARRDDAPDDRRWADVTRLAPLSRARGGMTAEDFRLYRVTGRAGAGTIAVMPRPKE